MTAGVELQRPPSAPGGERPSSQPQQPRHHLRHLSPEQFAALLRAERKLLWRVLALLVCLMFVNYIDRTNLAFASVQLNQDIGLSKATYGLGAGLFFAAYASMQIPANIMMTKIGGPVWLGVIALAWGIVAACFALIRGVPEFLALRFLLGVFEAGALPGMWAYMSHFYSKQRITQPLGYLMGSLIVSQALGAPIAAGLMSLDGRGGLRGWQWLFLVEGLLAVLVALAFFFMPADIDAVKGLTQEERDALHASMAHHAKPHAAVRPALVAALKNPAVWVAGGVIKFSRDVAFYGLMYFLPLIIQSLLTSGQPQPQQKPGEGHHTPTSITAILLSAVPFVASAAMQFFTCWHSQRRNERRWHLACCWCFGAVCLALLPLPQMRHVPAAAFVLLTLAVIGVFGVEGISISYYLALMGGEKGIGIAIINCLGALGGFVSPYVIGVLSEASGNFYSAAWLMAAFLAFAAAVAALTTEEWAAKFSLSPKQLEHHIAHLRQGSHRVISFPVGDAGMVAAAAAYLSSSDSDSACEAGAAADDFKTPPGASGDIEAGAPPPASP